MSIIKKYTIIIRDENKITLKLAYILQNTDTPQQYTKIDEKKLVQRICDMINKQKKLYILNHINRKRRDK